MARVELVSTDEGTFKASVTFSGDELTTLYSSPKQIVPAPGPNKMIALLYMQTIWNPELNGFVEDFTFGPYYGEGHLDEGSIAFFSFGLNFPGVPDGNVSIPYIYGSPSGTSTENIFNQPLYVGAAFFVDGYPDPIIVGPISSATVQDSGSGYVVGDTGIFDDPTYGNPTSYVVTGITDEGGVVSFTWTNDPGGAGYFQESGTETGGEQPGVGTGFSITLGSPPINGTITTNIIYQVIDNNG